MACPIPKILIFEDDGLTACASKATLESGGYRIMAVADEAVSGLLLAESEPPDAALVDVDLEGEIDGITFARALNDNYGTRIVFITSRPARVLSEVGDFRGVGIIAKPYDDHTLLETMQEALAGRNGGLSAVARA